MAFGPDAVGRLEEAGSFPRVVLLDTVSYCNLRCSMCVHRKMKRPRGMMPWELFSRLIDEIARENPRTRTWMVFFGEALILKRCASRPTIFDMIASAKRKGLTDVVLNSNGNLLDRDASQRLIDSGLDAIYFGVDAHSPETYAKLRGGGDYEKTVRGIRELLRLQREQAAPRPAIFVQFVEMDENRHEREAFVDFWQGEGARVKVRPKVSWAGSIPAANLVLGNAERRPCHWAMQTLSITDRGLVVTCAVDLDARFVAGDARRQTLKEIWNGPLQALREGHRAGDFARLPPFCRDCRDWQAARAEFYTPEP